MRITVVEYDERWPGMFTAEAERIADILGDEMIEVHHIGSTAIPGIKAKPIIDIMPIVRDIERIDAYNDRFIELGYEAGGELGIPGRRFFRKGGDERTHHVHIFDPAARGEIDRHLAFRDYMRAHPSEAKIYGELKEGLAERFPDDIDAYCDGKEEYIRRIEQQALEYD